MNWPTDNVMLAFLAMCRGVQFSTEGGVMAVRVPCERSPDGWRWQEITGEELDELLSRGWVALIDEDVIEACDSGIYWLNRWLDQKRKAERKARRTA